MSLEKCFGNNCPLKLTCIRYKEIEHKGYDTFFRFIPYRKEKKSCDFYISTSDNIIDELKDDGFNINIE